MSLILIISILIRLVALALSVALLRRIRDWRMGVLAVMLGLMALRQILTLWKTHESWSVMVTGQATELPGLIVSILVFLTVFYLAQMLTDHDRVETALRASESQVRLLMDSTAEAIYGLDLNGLCTFCNRACLSMLGYKEADDLIGNNMHDLIHHTRPDGTPDPINECRIYEGFRRIEGTHVDDEVLWRADGTSFSAEYWSYPVHHQGELIGSVVTFLDISERREMEKTLRSNETLLQAIMDHAPALISAKNRDGKIIVTNSRFEVLEGPAPEEFIGKTVYDLFPKQVANELWKNDVAAIEADAPQESLETVVHKDGNKHTYHTIKFPLYGEADSPFGTCAISVDISDRLTAEDALRESEERFRTIFQSAPDAVYLIAAEGEHIGRILAANETAERMLGYQPGDLVGKAITSLDETPAPHLDPEHVQR
ncbi:MAG: PAS domain S-box protein, partial [Planctomycetales bacterium]